MYFISDTHFFHKNIIKYCQRPFADVREMNAELIARWNRMVVDNATTILHVGDVTFHYDQAFAIVNQLNGNKELILGNHDWGPERMERLGFTCRTSRRNETYEFEFHGTHFVVAHRPRDIPTWTEGDTRVRVCGHEHNNAPHFIKWTRGKNDDARAIMCLNISCEYTDYAPIHIDEVVERWNNYMKAHGV